jgi:hypothetical protein
LVRASKSGRSCFVIQFLIGTRKMHSSLAGPFLIAFRKSTGVIFPRSSIPLIMGGRDGARLAMGSGVRTSTSEAESVPRIRFKLGDVPSGPSKSQIAVAPKAKKATQPKIRPFDVMIWAVNGDFYGNEPLPE